MLARQVLYHLSHSASPHRKILKRYKALSKVIEEELKLLTEERC
jgi:hypothetical protein